MVKRCIRMAALGAALLLGNVTLGQAQEQLDLSILNEGKPPPQPVTVSAIQNGEKVELATTNSAGEAAIDFNLLNLGKSTPVDVIVINCDGETQVILLPPGEVSEECEKAAENPDCECARIGTILWGDTRTATIRIDQGGITLETGEVVGAAPTAGGSGIRIGAGATWTTFGQLEDTGCSQTGITGCEVDDSSVGPYLTFEYTPNWGIPLGLGLRGDYKKVSVSQTFSGAGLPTSSHTDLDVLSAAAYLYLELALGGRTSLRPELGILNAWNSGTTTSEYASGPVSESRSESGIRGMVGLALQYDFSHTWDGRVGVRYINGDSDDADQQSEISLGAGFKVGGGR